MLGGIFHASEEAAGASDVVLVYDDEVGLVGEPLRGAVGGAVVDDDDAVVGVCLVAQTCDNFL